MENELESDSISGKTCLIHDCHACCLETEMSLTREDIVRISRAVNLPVEAFTVRKEGMAVLKNTSVKGQFQCFFLNTDGQCSIYRIKPQGCRYYPVIWDLDNQQAILHEYCPHREEFRGVVNRVKNEVKKLVHELLNGNR